MTDTAKLNRKRMAYVAIGAAFVVLAALAIGCASEGEEAPQAPSSRLSPAELRNAYAAICRSRGEVADDFMQAREKFYGEAHTTLHVLAEEIGEDDRRMAASLLEAKNTVEAALAGEVPDPAEMALDRLLSTLEQALLSLDVEPPSCSANVPERHS